MSNIAYRRLKFYWSNLTASECVGFWDASTPTELLFTDASDFGFGAHTSKITQASLFSGVWTEDDALRHISFKELKIVELALQGLAPLV